jgi:hypothetical protein
MFGWWVPPLIYYPPHLAGAVSGKMKAVFLRPDFSFLQAVKKAKKQKRKNSLVLVLLRIHHVKIFIKTFFF